jgi:hypothetical protein
MKVLEEFKGVDDHEFRVVEYDPSQLDNLKEFCNKAGSEGNKNNSSLKALKFGKWGALEYWTLVYYKDSIISMSGAHYLPHVQENCFYINYRLSTLDSWRTMCGARGSATQLTNEFGFGRMIPFQIDWALSKGATLCVNTTVGPPFEDNTGTMHKIWRAAKYVFPKHNKLTLIHEDFPLYGVKQDIYRFNVRDFATLEPINYGINK